MTRTLSPPAVPALIGAAALSAAAIPLWGAMPLGRVSGQMVEHLLVMNVLAPLAAVALTRRGPLLAPGTPTLAAAAAAQMILLWAWHAPAAQRAVMALPFLHGAAALVLALAALVFWIAVIEAAGRARWIAVLALLVTGKLACLLGALMIFAPRDLYGLPAGALAFCSVGPSSLADQQLAGLLMVTACPLSYVAAGIAIAVRAIAPPERVHDAAPARR